MEPWQGEGGSLCVLWRCDTDRMRLGYSTTGRPHGVRCGRGTRWEYEVRECSMEEVTFCLRKVSG